MSGAAQVVCQLYLTFQLLKMELPRSRNGTYCRKTYISNCVWDSSILILSPISTQLGRRKKCKNFSSAISINDSSGFNEHILSTRSFFRFNWFAPLHLFRYAKKNVFAGYANTRTAISLDGYASNIFVHPHVY